MRALFISPHTDDVELGAGGTLVKLLEEGNEVYWVVFSTAEDSLPQGTPPDTLRREFLSVVDDLGLDKGQYKILNFRVRYLPEHRQEVLEELVRIKKEYSPDLVVGPSLDDYHQDHQVVAWEMIRAFKNSASIISYELPWNHVRFNTQLFVRLEERYIDRKISLLSHYQSQVSLNRPYFSEDFIRGWARTRGVQVGARYAEAFEVIRWIL